MLTAIVTAGGAGVRFGGEKILVPVLGEPLIFHTLRRIGRMRGVVALLLTLPPDRIEAIRAEQGEALERLGVTDWIPGGATRMESVGNALAAAETDLVLVHDAVRPVFDVAAADRAVAAAREIGAAIVARPARDTLKRVDAELRVTDTVPREEVWHAETPQVARREALLEAYRRAEADGFTGTDEASLMERIGVPVTVVDGGPWNVKVTERGDLAVVTALLNAGERESVMEHRVGYGYDIHQFTEGKPMMIGGVTIPSPRGFLGHSDGDVLLHALCDALLGAAGLGDIGEHFPDTDPRFRGAASAELTTHLVGIVTGQGWRVANADLTVVIQEPKMHPYKERIRQSVAELLEVDAERVNVKAKTNEGLDAVGENLAAAAHVVILIERQEA